MSITLPDQASKATRDSTASGTQSERIAWLARFVGVDVATYIEGGAGAGQAVTRNEQSWREYHFRPHVLRARGDTDVTTSIFGLSLAAPILAAPWAHQTVVCPEGELATARGIASVQLGLCLASGLTRPIAEVAAVSGPYLQQLYLTERREESRPFLEAAAAAGARAIVVTVDNPPVGATLGFRAALRSQRLINPNFPAGSEFHLAKRTGLDDVEWVREASGLPVVVKGLLRADDARRAVDSGAAGVVVSNHGGRQLAADVTAAEVLPDIVAEVGSDAVVLADGGIATGEDVVCALALGADAVLVGRPFARALATGGEAGVADLGDTLIRQTRAAVRLMGVDRLNELSSDLLRERAGAEGASGYPAGPLRASWEDLGQQAATSEKETCS